MIKKEKDLTEFMNIIYKVSNIVIKKGLDLSKMNDYNIQVKCKITKKELTLWKKVTGKKRYESLTGR